jgi:ribosomal protein S18 acetylase RimI-like enzyme
MYNRDYQFGTDLQKITDLFVSARPRAWLSDYPSPNDLSEAFKLPSTQRNTRLWFNHANKLIAFAWVDIYQNLWFEIDLGARGDALESHIVAWGDQCVRRKDNCRSNQSLDTNCRSNDHYRKAFLKRNNFHQTPNETIIFTRSLNAPISSFDLPPGFRIRPLKGSGEIPKIVTLHQAAFGTENMNNEERLAMMNSPDYDPELDIVITNPGGSIVAYCFCSINRLENTLTGRAVGCTDPIAVHPDFQRRGLARALLCSGLGLLRARNMQEAQLSTSAENLAMQKTARSVGFLEACRKVWFRRAVSSQ